MKRMKFTLGLLSLALVLTTFFVSCNNEEEIVINKKELKKDVSIYSFVQDTVYKYSNGIEIKSIIKSTFPITKRISEIEIENKIKNGHKVEIEFRNSSEIKAFNIQYPNNKLCSTCKRDKDGNISDSLECSTECINQCAFSTYQQWSNAKIIVGSLVGAAQAVFGDCLARNCIGY